MHVKQSAYSGNGNIPHATIAGGDTAPASGRGLPTNKEWLLFLDAGGTINAVRSMWSDKTPAVSVNNDVPTEMRMHPNDLGTLILE